jgi:predicted kinase
MNEQLILIRGLPGSGKTTYAKTLRRHILIEADIFFEDENGNYNFDPKKLPEAHGFCQKVTRILLKSGQNVVVANTFTQLWELQPYIDMAVELGLSYKIIRMNSLYENIHNVPEDTIKRMKDRFIDVDGEELIL